MRFEVDKNLTFYTFFGRRFAGFAVIKIIIILLTPILIIFKDFESVAED